MRVHMDAARPRTERLWSRRPVVALLAAVPLTAAFAVWAVVAARPAARTPLAWAAVALALVLCAAVGAAVRHWGERSRGDLRRIEEAEAAAERIVLEQQAETTAFGESTLPTLLKQFRDGASTETALASVRLPDDDVCARVLFKVADELGRSERRRAAAMSVGANAAGRVQALTTSMLADLREMELRHDSTEVLDDLLHLDQRIAQAGRLADSIAVLTGARSGRRWAKPIVMESVLRGALGRIADYRRVRLHAPVGVAIAGHAAEGVMHALAEILDNACNFSPPNTEVHVYIAEVPVGVMITVEDSGLVMGEVALRRAERAVSGRALDLSHISGTRIGLAVVGSLANKYGLTVSFRPSASGGTGVVLMVPRELVKRVEPDQRRTTRPAAGQAGRPAPPDSAAPGGPRSDAQQLPRRRRGRTLNDAHPDGIPAPPAEPVPATRSRHRAECAARFSAFHQAMGGGRPAATKDRESADTTRASTTSASSSHSEDDR